MLLDTGATLCAINMRTFRDIDNLLWKRRGIRLRLTQQMTNSSPVAANRTRLRVKGLATLDVIFPGKDNVLRKTVFSVIPGLNARCIIGLPALRQLGLEVFHNKIKVAGHQVSLIDTVDIMQNESETLSDSNYQPTLEPITQQGDATEMEGTSPIDNRKDIGDHYKPGCKLGSTTSTLCQTVLNDQSSRDLIVTKEIRKLVDNSDLSHSGKLSLKKILQRRRKVFSTSELDVGCYGKAVKLRFKSNDCEPVYVPCRRVPHALRGILEEYLMKMEASEIISRTDGSPWNSPLFFVRKKNLDWRPVSDFRMLNKGLVSWNFPIPHLRDLLDRLDGSKLFTAIDLRSGFFNIMLDEESRECTAFSVLGQTWQFNRLPQGIKQSPAIFQAIMTTIMRGVKDVLVYMDDLLIYSKSENDTLATINEVLKRFNDFGLKVNLSKSEFVKTKINYLGYEVSPTGWRPTRSKILAIQKMEAPKSTKDCRAFAGMLNFCSAAIPRLSVIIGPINQLTGKKKFDWTDEAQKAFDDAKRAISNAVNLSFPSKNDNDRLIVTSDASDDGWGGCLSQIRTKSGIEQPLGFTSGTWHDAEIRWPIAEKELAAFMRTLRHFDTYLVARVFTWRTDNRSLSYMLTE